MVERFVSIVLYCTDYSLGQPSGWKVRQYSAVLYRLQSRTAHWLIRQYSALLYRLQSRTAQWLRGMECLLSTLC